MIKNFKCVNISSKDPKALADFYMSIGAPVYIEDGSYDGQFIGDPKQGGTVCVWDENSWGKSTEGFVTIVLETDDVHKTYEEITSKGINIDPPRTADWGGQELVFKDIDGNIVMLL